MAIFFFNTVSDGNRYECEGVELYDEKEARLQGVRMCGDMLKELSAEGTTLSQLLLEIKDGNGRLIYTLQIAGRMAAQTASEPET